MKSGILGGLGHALEKTAATQREHLRVQSELSVEREAAARRPSISVEPLD